jgi:O-glycosyl hydrolase
MKQTSKKTPKRTSHSLKHSFRSAGSSKWKPAIIFASIIAIAGGLLIWRSFAAVSPSAADLNGDGVVNLSDLSILLSNYGKTTSTGDLDGDGKVAISDLSALLSNYGKTVSTTPPAPPPPPVGNPTVTVTVNGSNKGTVMDGFGIAANSASWKNGELKPVIDKYLAENGASIWRVILDEEDWETTNDNSDPNVYDTAAYTKMFTSPKFEDLWSTIAYLNSKGVNDLLEISFMGQSPDWMGGFHLNGNSQDEFAETMTAAVQYAYKTRGLKFGLFSPNNEPQSPSFVEGTDMSDSVAASVYAKIATKMDADGLTSVKLVGPESTTVGAATNSGMAAAFRGNSTVMSKLAHFSGHLYANSIGSGDTNAINSVPKPATYWMSEVGPPFGSTGQPFDAFWGQLVGGPAGFIMWEGYDSVYNHAIRNNLGSAPANDDGGLNQMVNYNASSKVYTYNKDFYRLGQVWRFVRPGMQYIGTTSSYNSISFRSYKNTTTGALTIVGYNTGAAQIVGVTLSGTPSPSVMHFYDTTGSGKGSSTGDNIKQGVDATVTNNTLRAAVPANSVFTLTTL